MMRVIALIGILITELSTANPRDRPSFTIKRSIGSIKLDGVLDEVSWKDAEIIDQLIQQFPYDTSRARVRTEFRLTYDDRFLYVSAIAYDKVPCKYVVSSLRRDFRGPGVGSALLFN